MITEQLFSKNNDSNFFYWKGYFNKQLNEFKTRKNNFNSQLISMISAEQSPTPSKKKTNK